ncbi:MAG: hypothetical protein J6W82_07300 [Bacteroidales bacterium]|nr:hypothetical protein [Bacteroidales bacterium]
MARYFITDHLGSTRVIINPDGTIRGRADYLPYGKFLLRTGAWRENNDYLWTGKEQLTPFFEAYWYDSGARYLFTNGLFASLDPLAEKYPGISPYAYCAGDPVHYVDVDGNALSTHTDQNGNVVAVFDDGDLGVYRHSGIGEEAKNKVFLSYSSNNTSAGGEKMGESLQPFSFATDTKTKKKVALADETITINFTSTQLTEAVQGIIDAHPSLFEYMKNAHLSGDWDLKNQQQYKNKGSLLFGRYASPRDAGNFMAGYFSASNEALSPFIDFGYGFYNLSGNNTTRTIINAACFICCPVPTTIKVGAFNLIRLFGEDKISRTSQKAGKQYYLNDFSY